MPGFPGGRGELLREGLRGGHHWLPHLLMVMVLAAFVALLVWLLIRATRQPGGGAAVRPTVGDSALARARMRYASGEISREEFLTLAEDLGGAPPPPPEG